LLKDIFLHVKYREYPPTIKNNSYGSILLVWKTVQITLVRIKQSHVNEVIRLTA
jgi:hypothetical protein